MAREVARAQKWCTICHDGDFGWSRNRYTFGNSKPGGLVLSGMVGISTMATSDCKSNSRRVEKADRTRYINRARRFLPSMHQRNKNLREKEQKLQKNENVELQWQIWVYCEHGTEISDISCRSARLALIV